jgi:hypothetical protein
MAFRDFAYVNDGFYPTENGIKSQRRPLLTGLQHWIRNANCAIVEFSQQKAAELCPAARL